MVHIKHFEVEQYMNAHELWAKYNLAESCCDSISLADISALSQIQFEFPTSKRLDYGHISGSPGLRSSIANLYSPPLPEQNILVSNGAIGANFLVLYTLVSPGDHVICVHPTYQQLYDVPSSFGAEVELLRLKSENGYVPDVEALRNMIRQPEVDGSGGTKLIILNNPNNPTGATTPGNILQSIVEIAALYKIPILSDEVYRPLFHSTLDTPPSIVELYEYGIATGSLSKAFSLAGIRVGWIATRNAAFIENFVQGRDYNTISVSMIDDYVASYALSRGVVEKILARNMELSQSNLVILKEFVEKSNGRFKWHPPTAGTTTLMGITTPTGSLVDDVEFCERLQNKTGVMLVPAGLCFGEEFKGYVRIGYCCATQVLKDGLQKLDSFVKGDF